MENYLLEHGRFEEAHDSSVIGDVPNDSTAIERGRDSLSVVFANLDVRHSSSVLLHRSLHDLGLASNSPDSHFSLHTSGDDLVARVGES